MLESPFNKVTGQICNFIKKRLQHSCFTVNHRKSEINSKLTKVGSDFRRNILSSIVGNWLDGCVTLKVLAVWIMMVWAKHQTKSKQWCGFQ